MEDPQEIQVNTKEVKESLSQQTPKKTRKANIRCKNLFKIYNQGNLEVVALRRINLNIYQGEIVVIMGPSGSGKTTLLNCLAGLERPTAGQIFLKNFEVNKLNDQGVEMLLQNEVGIIFQFFNLIPSLNSKGNVELPMVIAQRKNAEINRRSAELFKQIGLEKRTHQNPMTLSGGEKQRVAIAMAIANDPTVLLADEPTGNVDSISGENVMNLFTEFIKTHPDKSLVIVTHDHNLLKIADRTLILKDGKIIRELGKYQTKAVKNLDDIEEIDEIAKIYEASENKKQIEEILSPSGSYPHYDEITECRKCDSTNIRKMYDKEAGHYKMHNNQLITRIVVNCLDCEYMEYRTASITELQKKQN